MLCTGSLGKKHKGIYLKVEVEAGNEVSACNRLLFIENLKLLAKKEEALNEMMIEAQEFL